MLTRGYANNHVDNYLDHKGLQWVVLMATVCLNR